MKKDKKENGFVPENSTSFVKIRGVKINDYDVGLVSDTIKFKGFSYPLTEYQFFLVEKERDYGKDYEGLFGYGLDKCPDKTEALLDVLKEKDPNMKDMISIKQVNYTHGLLTIGDLPKEITDNMQRYRECDVVVKQTGKKLWLCQLYSVYLDNGKMFKIKNGALGIALGGNNVHLPRSEYDDIKDELFIGDIYEKKCVETLDDYSNTVCCNSDFDINKLGHITYVMGKWSIKIPLKSLFYEHENQLCLALVNSQPDVWFISPSVLKDYTIVLNKEDMKIGFYHEDTLE